MERERRWSHRIKKVLYISNGWLCSVCLYFSVFKLYDNYGWIIHYMEIFQQACTSFFWYMTFISDGKDPRINTDKASIRLFRVAISNRRSLLCGILVVIYTLIAKFMRPTWGPPGSCRPQMCPMLTPWTLLSGTFIYIKRVLSPCVCEAWGQPSEENRCMYGHWCVHTNHCWCLSRTLGSPFSFTQNIIYKCQRYKLKTIASLTYAMLQRWSLKHVLENITKIACMNYSWIFWGVI